MLKKLPPFVKNIYFILIAAFLIWMFFLDGNDFINQYKLRKKRVDLEKEEMYYKKQIEEVKKDREALMSDEELLEQFAREKYLMRKKEEDLYLLIEE